MLQFLREQRALIVLDNLETLLEEGEVVGRMRAGYEGYGILLRRISETGHQSCLLFTSREKPTSLVALEGNLSLIRLLRLARLEAKPCEQLLAEKGMVQALRRSPNGTKLASAGADGAIMVWDLATGEQLQTLRRDRPYERMNIRGVRGLNDAQKSTLLALGAMEDQADVQ